MKPIKKIAWFIMFITVFASCKDSIPEKEVEVPLSSEKELVSFTIESALNADLNKDFIKEDVKGEIEKNAIKFSLLEGTQLTNLIATFTFEGEKVLVNGIEQKSKVTTVDFSKPVAYVVFAEDGSKLTYSVNIEIIKKTVPVINIITAGGATIQRDYLTGEITIDGKGYYDNFNATTRIKGRGNSTWSLAKKPYKIKLDKKASVLGLKESKEWVLLANHLDGTLMLNAVAMKIGHLIDFPNTNNIIPVDLVVNGVNFGSYNLTEQVGVEENRVNIKDGGVLLELDTYFDEPFKFYSESYKLPVMVKYPELEDYSVNDAGVELGKIKTDFKAMEDLVFDPLFPNNKYKDLIDVNALVKYLIVYNLTDNEELNHPKSTYMHKAKGGKYIMGPLWDFDWAYGFENGGGAHFRSSMDPLLWNGQSSGTRFFKQLMTDPVIKQLYKQEWSAFKANKLPSLLLFVDGYSQIISASQKANYQIWKDDLKQRGADFEGDVKKLRKWLQDRAAYIDSYVAGL